MSAPARFLWRHAMKHFGKQSLDLGRTQQLTLGPLCLVDSGRLVFFSTTTLLFRVGERVIETGIGGSKFPIGVGRRAQSPTSYRRSRAKARQIPRPLS